MLQVEDVQLAKGYMHLNVEEHQSYFVHYNSKFY